MEKQNKDKMLMIILVILVLALVCVFLLRDKDEKGAYSNQPLIVTDNSSFYTVSSCVSKYVGYLYNKDIDNLLILLNQKYIEKNKIDSNNIFEYLGTLNSYQTFKAKKMYVKQVDDHIYKYYVYGILEEEFIDSNAKYVGDLYMIVYLNEDGMTFSVEPYNGEIFK